jgi:glyoxylase-like metal-dependent hydrolase (beta-lactamase superfamily II)
MKRLFMIVALLTLMLPLAGHSETTMALGPDVTVTQLSDRVWMHTTRHVLENGQIIPSNGLIVAAGEDVVLVDTPWGIPQTRAVLDWTTRTIGRTVNRAVLTHGHEDRIAGLPVLRSEGIELFYAARATLGAAAREGDVWLQDTGTRIPVADGVEVFYPGAAHTPDNLMVWISPEAVLFGGCAVRADAATGLGNTADADLQAWRRAIHYVLTRYPEPRLVVPGHGDPGPAELLVLTRGHIARAEDAARDAP